MGLIRVIALASFWGMKRVSFVVLGIITLWFVLSSTILMISVLDTYGVFEPAYSIVEAQSDPVELLILATLGLVVLFANILLFVIMIGSYAFLFRDAVDIEEQLLDNGEAISPVSQTQSSEDT